MVIRWPGAYCEGGSVAHYNVEIQRSGGASLFGCKHCQALTILPNGMNEAERLGELMRSLGKSKGYTEFLHSCSGASSLLALLGKIRYIEEEEDEYEPVAKRSKRMVR